MFRKFAQFREQQPIKFVIRLIKNHRFLLILQVAGGLGVAVFEGLTLVLFAFALQTLASESVSDALSSLGILGDLIQKLGLDLDRTALFFILLVLAVGSQLFKSLMEFGGDIASAHLQARVESETRSAIFQQFMKMSYPQISEHKAGELASYMEQTNYLGTTIDRFGMLTNQILLVITYGIVLLWVSIPMTLIALLGLMLISFSLRKIVRHVRRMAKKYKNATVAITQFTVEFLHGIVLLHTFARQDYAIKRLEPVIQKSMQARKRGLIWQASISPLVDSLTVIGIAVFLVVGYLLVDLTSSSYIARLGTFLFVVYRLMPRISVINKNWGLLNSYWPFVERIALLLSTKDKEFVTSGPKEFTGLARCIEFRNVSMQYNRNTENESYPAVDNLSFIVTKGEMIALVGESGAGKSSVVNLLLRLFDYTSGEIRVDDVRLQELDLQSWRSHIGVVSQDNFIFNMSIRENIAFGKLDATDSEIIRAAKIAHAHEFIMLMPEGYETIVGDQGSKLSGGQRQRIAIARAVVRNPEILILDEATSDLDSQSEREIQKAVEDLRSEYTIVSIAHRLSTIAIADKILVLDRGKLAEMGTHEELIKMSSRYHRLWQLQSIGSSGSTDSSLSVSEKVFATETP